MLYPALCTFCTYLLIAVSSLPGTFFLCSCVAVLFTFCLLLPYLTWTAESQGIAQSLSSGLRVVTNSVVGDVRLPQDVVGAVNPKWSLQYADLIMDMIAFPRRANRDELGISLRGLMERISSLLGMLPVETALWLMGFVVPYALADSYGEANRPSLLIEQRSPPVVSFTLTRRIDNMGMEIWAKIHSPEAGWAKWGSPGDFYEGLNIGDVMIVQLSKGVQGHLMILEVKFAKPKKSPEGKAITDRKKVTAFG